MVRVGGHGCGAGGAPGAVRGGGVSESVAKALRAGVGGEKKRGISTFLFRRFGVIGAFATDLGNRRRRGPLRGRRPRRSPRHSGRPPTPGRLFSGRLRAFPGNDIMMAHSHEVQFVVEQAREDRLNNRILVLSGGRLVRASDPYPGSMHDVAALDASGLLKGIDPSRWIADKGYVGRGMITPHKKPPNGELSEAAKEASKSINRIRRAERADHRPHQVLENPPAPTTAAPCTHSNRPSPPHSHSTSSKTPSE